MSYIGLLNESHMTTYTNVSASDDLTVGTSLRNLGSLTQIGPATFSGSLIGLLTTVSNGSDLTYTYTPATKTFNIQINNGSITNSKLSNSSISIDGQLMTLGASYTTQLSTITNAMLAGSIALSKLASGSPLQIIICNGSGIPTYSALTLNNLPFGTANQFLQTSGSNNAWITLSGDASLSSGVLTIGNAAITNAKLLNSIITLDGQAMSLGSSYTTPLLAITNGMLAGSISLSKLASGSVGQILIVNALGNAIYGSLTLNNLPFGTANQFLQTSGSSNAWITLSGDASLSAGVLTIGNAAITNAKLLNSSITLNGTSMSLGGTYSTTTPLLSITNGMLAGSIDNSKLLNNSITIGATYIPLGSTISTISPTILSTDSITGSTTTSIIDLFTNTNQSNINSRTQIKYGLSNLTTPSASNPSLVLGSLEAGNLYDGVIHIYGSAGAKHCIQASSNNNLYLNTPSGGNLFLNGVALNTNSSITLGTTAISLGGTYSGIAGALSFTGTSSFTNGSNVQGAPYSAVFGQASTTRSGQIALIDGTSSNQYAQLYCRSNVFGIQGNITSISLQKPTTITGSLSLTNGILNLGADATTNSQIVLNSALTTYAYQIATNTIGELSINTLSAFASVIKIGADIFTQTTIGKLIVSGLTQLVSLTASGTATITGLTSANGGLIIGTNGTSILRQKLYSVTSSVGSNTTDEYNLTISGFTTTPQHIIASLYNNGTTNCSIIARATSATNINYWVGNSNIIPSTFTAYFTISQI